MSILSQFDVSAAIFTGSDHYGERSNCQDHYVIRDGKTSAVLAVADGVSSGRCSEAGAMIGLELLANCAMSAVSPDLVSYRRVKAVQWQEVLNQYITNIQEVVYRMDERSKQDDDLFATLVRRYFLHTTVLLLIDAETWQLVRFGDGYAGINNLIITDDILYEDNMPPLPAYYLYQQMELEGYKGTDWEQLYPAGLTFEVVASGETSALDTFMLGTDGLRYIEHNADQPLPGRSRLVGPLEQFMRESWGVNGAPTLQSQLNLIGKPYPQYEPDDPRKPSPGYLKDDVAMITGRRKEL